MFDILLNYLIFIHVINMSRNSVRYIICMFYFLCKVAAIIKVNKLICFSDIAVTINVYGVSFVYSNVTIVIMICFLLFILFVYNY